MHTAIIDDWVFLLDDDPAAARKAADEAAYRRVRVPHDWSVEHPFDQACSSGTGYLPGGVGWYRAHVSIAALGLAEAAAVRLVFHGVYKRSQVWVNGYHVGGRASGHAEFSFDVTEIVSYAPDDDLVISVRVDRRDLADSRWYNGTGITRRVEIVTHDPVSLAHHGTAINTLTASAEQAQVEVVQRVQNHTDVARSVTVTHALDSADDAASTSVAAGEHLIEVPAKGESTLRTVVTIERPSLWSDGHPHLYRLTTTIADPEPTTTGDESLTSVQCETFGVRTIAFDPDTGFHVNGEHRVLKGVCVHEDAGPLGVAVPTEVWLRRLLTLKQAGCNALRMAHNPHAPELYDLCDLVGLYVIDEAFDEFENPKNKWWQGHNVYPPKHDGYAADFPEWHERDLVAMIEAHRNHPSVIAWSVGNEVDYPNDPYVSALFEQMTGNNDANKPDAERVYDANRPDIRRLTTLTNRLIDIVKAHDTTRPVTFAAAFPELSSHTGLLDRLDLIGYNYKEELYPDDHRRFPQQPFVGSENGHSYAAWRAVTDQPFVAGQFLWTGIDFLGETVGWPSHGSEAGIVTTAGFPKERWHLRRSWWVDDPVIRLAARPAADDIDEHMHRPFARDWTPGDILDVACFSNADTVRLTHGDTSIDMVFDDDLGFWRASVMAVDDALVATGRWGDEVRSDTLQRRGEPAGLTASVWQAPAALRGALDRIDAEAAQFRQVEVQVVDRDGLPARGEVHLAAEVSGGVLLGLDNGNHRDTTPFPDVSRSTHEGRMIVHVQGADATLTLRADDLGAIVLGMGSSSTATTTRP